MNKTTPKKIMEIVFIFIIPLFLVISNFTYQTIYENYSIEEEKYQDVYKSLVYENYIISSDSPIYEIMEIPFNLLGFYETNYLNIIVDYTTLWFSMFIIWHLLYLFFDTLMHKVLLRKD